MQISFDMKALTDQIQTFLNNFKDHLDINQLLGDIRAAVISSIEQMVVSAVEQQFRSQDFLTTLKMTAAKSGLRFHGFKPTSIRLLSGNSISIDSPYFAKAKSKRRLGRKSKKRTAETGCHVGLAYLGFLSRSSNLLVSSAVQSALLCPSFEIAQRTLQSFGIQLDVKTIQRFCEDLGVKAMQNRNDIALTDADSASGRILFVCMDGGRLRERRTKRGRRPDNLKRQGYHTDWREPIQIVIQLLDTSGNPCKDIPPIYDATLAGVDGAFDLLEAYLIKLDAPSAHSVVFCGDGARSYWKRFPLLAQKLGIDSHYEIIDYTHAKQNLQEIIDKLPESIGPKKLAKIIVDWKSHLWNGNHKEILRQIHSLIQSPTKLGEALKKFNNYFSDNFHRMQYSSFRELGLPTGSGCVESAVRRVINLRLKSPGIFWKPKNAEVMLFLRSTLLCGRWKNMLENLFRLNRSGVALCH
jgi:hypothetical protein